MCFFNSLSSSLFAHMKRIHNKPSSLTEVNKGRENRSKQKEKRVLMPFLVISLDHFAHFPRPFSNYEERIINNRKIFYLLKSLFYVVCDFQSKIPGHFLVRHIL